MSDEGWDDDAEEWEFEPEEMLRIERNGLFTVVLGILAQTTAMFVCCTYGLTAFPALIMGAVALFLGNMTLGSGVQGAPRAYAIVGMATGGIAVAWSAFVLFCCGLYLAFYAVMIGLVMGAGNF